METHERETHVRVESKLTQQYRSDSRLTSAFQQPYASTEHHEVVGSMRIPTTSLHTEPLITINTRYISGHVPIRPGPELFGKTHLLPSGIWVLVLVLQRAPTLFTRLNFLLTLSLRSGLLQGLICCAFSLHKYIIYFYIEITDLFCSLFPS